MGDRPDTFRVGTFHLNNVAGETSAEKTIQLCAGMLVYAYTITTRSAAEVVPEVLAEWHLQDSAFLLPSLGCAIASDHADLPGLHHPASSKLIAPPGSDVWLHLTYGQCKRHVP